MLEFLAKTNRFHWMTALCWQSTMLFATQMLFSIFSSYVPRWRCALNQTTANISTPFGKNCTEYLSCSQPSTIQFEHIYFHSAALEFDWVCGPKAYLKALYSQVQFAGVLIGTVLFGSLSDYFGRRPIALITQIVGISMIFLSGMAPTGELLIASRFFIGLCNAGTIKTLVMELILPEQRGPYAGVLQLARLAMTVACFLLPDWRSATYACGAYSLPGLLLVIFAIPESPIWLHNKGKLEEMRACEKKIARIAGKRYEEVHHEPVQKMQSFTNLIKDPVLFQRLSVLWVMWFVASLCSYTNDLNSNEIVGHLFLNQALFSVFIVISKTFLLPFDAFNFNRRNLHHYSQLAVIICFVALTGLVLIDYHGTTLLIINLFGCAFIEYTWDACNLCAIESMPTTMRATAIGSCSLMARIAAILAPLLAYMNTIWAPTAYVMVVIFGSISLLISYNWLVETRGIDLDCVKLHEDQVRKNGYHQDNGVNVVEEQLKMLSHEGEVK